ncbi:hypothetical protein QQS21_005383 [Conoideocrella luteorostrata]|uniref:Ankyrin n=1 Tax=Conoideocrella luteorostrata TaxID=1105319 RepID=A0AAJ0G0Y3_9HYPO|nr:hypothetical protein QQS21_005383 [Conoideocrella luteorostrata]
MAAGLQSCPSEILNIIIDHLVITIGPKAVFLRTVNRAFDSAILDAICVRQVIDSKDIWWAMSSAIQGRIAEVKSRSAEAASEDWLSVIASVNRALDTLTGETDEKLLKQRHEAVAETVYRGINPPDKVCDAKWEAQNLLSGAIIIGSLPIVKSILASRREPSNSLPEVNGATPYFGRPLVLAAGWGNLEIVRYLLDSGARSDTICSCSTFRGDVTPIHEDWNPKADSALWGVRFGNGHPATAPSALRAAVLGGHGDIVRILLQPEYRLPPSKTEYLAAIVAAARLDLDLIQIMLDAIGKSLSDFPGLGQEMMWEAIKYGREDVAQMLLDKGAADVNPYVYGPSAHIYGTPLQYAALIGSTNMMRFFLERGAIVNVIEKASCVLQPIEGAAQCGHVEGIDMLLEQGAEPVDALRSAAKSGQLHVVRLLLDKFPDLIQRNKGEIGRSAVFWALTRKNLAVLTLLVERGASLNEGYENPPEGLPINMIKGGYGSWVVNHLISLGAEETDVDTLEESYFPSVRGVRVREHTWQWAGKY